MKAGVYIVKELFSEQKYILSLNGKEESQIVFH